MSRTFFTADQHFGHAEIIARCARPFASVVEMDEMMITNWNALVRPCDTVWHCGDFAHHSDAKRLRTIFDRLNGQKHLVFGNHDEEPTRRLPWASQQQMACISVEGERYVICHYALRVWPGLHRGAIHLYGHSHGRLPGTSQSLDTGVDCWRFWPVDIPRIKARLTELPNVKPEADPNPSVSEMQP